MTKFSPSWRSVGWFFLGLVGLFFLPQLSITFLTDSKIHSQIQTLPTKEYGVLFGARVFGENQLSDAAKERADATVVLFKAGKIQKVFISGTNQANQEVENLAKYLVSQGVPEAALTLDKLGIDTHDTCRHLHTAQIKDAVLITQAFHLPRAMWMCQKPGANLVGIEVNQLGLLANRADNLWQIWSIRTQRFIREAVLTWSYLLGFYDWYSSQAEQIEKSSH